MDHQSLSQYAALIIVDMQEDFCEPNGALAVPGGRELAHGINRLLGLPFKLKIATRDDHPSDHCSFASQHPGAKPFTSSHTIINPDSSEADVEKQTTTLWPDHCIQGTPGADLIPELSVFKIHEIVKKGQDKRVESYSAFGPPFRKPHVGMSSLNKTLEKAGIQRVYTCGLALDFCVKHTTLDAVEAGYEAFLVEDLTRSVDAIRKEHGISELTARGVKIVQSQDLISA